MTKLVCLLKMISGTVSPVCHREADKQLQGFVGIF